MPTFAPGCQRVPRCRMMMLPGMTCSPPNFFTPSRWPGESRPLRELPPAFLCAISCLLDPSASGYRDLADAQHRLQLAMAALAPIVLAPLLLEHDHLLGLALLQHLGHHLGALDQGRADLQLAAVLLVTDHQHLIEGDRLAHLAIEALDLDHLAGGNPILLSAGADHCVH